MNRAELVATLTGIQTALPISMDLVYANNGMCKTGNPYINAIKSNTLSGMIGMDYENGVNNQLSREGKEMVFNAKPHPWMCHAENNLGKNRNKEDGKRYIPIKVQSATSSVYTLDGVDVTDKVQAFLPKKPAPKTQDDLEKKVIWRTPDLDSIKTIRMLGRESIID